MNCIVLVNYSTCLLCTCQKYHFIQGINNTVLLLPLKAGHTLHPQVEAIEHLQPDVERRSIYRVYEWSHTTA